MHDCQYHKFVISGETRDSINILPRAAIYMCYVDVNMFRHFDAATIDELGANINPPYAYFPFFVTGK